MLKQKELLSCLRNIFTTSGIKKCLKHLLLYYIIKYMKNKLEFVRNLCERQHWDISSIRWNIIQRGIREGPQAACVGNIRATLSDAGKVHYKSDPMQWTDITIRVESEEEFLFIIGHELYHFLKRSKQIRGKNKEEPANLLGAVFVLLGKGVLLSCPECKCSMLTVKYKMEEAYEAQIDLETATILVSPHKVRTKFKQPTFKLFCMECDSEVKLPSHLSDFIRVMLDLFDWGMYNEDTMVNR
jgi:hypothetical protein